MGSSRVGQRSCIRAVTCVFLINMMNLISNGSSARENWPESQHEFIWPCGSQCSVFHFSSHICISYCFGPLRSGQLFGVDRFGGYLFTKRSALDAFLSGSSANDADRHLLRGHHLLRALEEITSGTGQVHDEQLGDGFLLTAPEPWYSRVSPDSYDQSIYDRCTEGGGQAEPSKSYGGLQVRSDQMRRGVPTPGYVDALRVHGTQESWNFGSKGTPGEKEAGSAAK